MVCAAQQTTPPPASDSSAPTQQQNTTQPNSSAQPAPPKPASAQTTPQQPDKGKPAQTDGGQGKVEGTSNDRLLYALPNFLTLEKGAKLPPLTVKDKFKVVALGTFDPVQYPWWASIAAVGQAANSEPGYGQGWLGYAKRYGATAGDSTIENFMVGAIFPSIIHQDPRFYYSEHGGFVRRTGYAISRIFVTRTDSGHAEFNYSEIFGSATAAAISTYTYHPKSTYVRTPTNPHLFVPSDRTLTNTANVWGTQVGLDTITIVIKEFWPDIHHKLAHKSEAKTAAAASSNP